MKKLILSLLSFSIVLASCSDFLEEVSQDQIVPQTVADYSEFLYGEIYNKRNEKQLHIWLDIMTDDCSDYAVNKGFGRIDQRISGFGYYTWQQDPEIGYDGKLVKDEAWAHYYHQILMSNIVLDGVEELEASGNEKAYVQAECYMIRALAYFMLVNIYGEPYSPASAETAMGVPVNNMTGPAAATFKRESVGQIYRQIIEDIENAEKAFARNPGSGSVFRWSLSAAQLLRARVALFMEDWDNAKKYASLVISTKSSLYDLKKKISDGNQDLFFFNSNNPEILMSYGTIFAPYYATGASGVFQVSPELISIYESGDLRYHTKTGQFIRGRGTGGIIGAGVRPIQYKADDVDFTSGRHGLTFRTAEAYLIRAEAYAHSSSEYLKAVDDLNTLRESRFSQDAYQELNLSTQAEILDFIKEERRRELCFEYLRWFDLRRGDRPSITHSYQTGLPANSEVLTFVLQENDPAYTIPAPSSVIEMDPEMGNPTRPERISE